MVIQTSAKDKRIENVPPALALRGLLLILLAGVAGVLLAALVLPVWLPGLSASLLGPGPKIFWYLSRASAIVAYLLVWVSMALGLGITNRLAQFWPGAPTTYDLHQYAAPLHQL